ncbi:MAG: tyrosine--tRNA ligase [Caldiserica bacterium CG02_land_8_20_14_3_00_36_38]|nr:tyrosine--tRNA ligase [Caldisericota bacterium]OIP12604.1 MAG: tyrosine--tRNA ligase [Caldisericum sp. CG2_30_36_11]PIV55890.1 MAG: tyrosine--tRNA ligase [Caldiserica bacterium CG02_land_8_20_14_3_00_36_38]
MNTIEKLRRKTAEIINESELIERIESGKTLRVKLGADPTAPDLHLGHYVVLRKLRDFQELGHRVIFIIGDFTGLVGDPSGRSKTRPTLTREQIDANAQTYFEQVFKILDRDKTEVRYNSEWLSKITFEEWFRICSNFTIARILERDDFLNRFKNDIPIYFHEFFYPIMQAYDSVAIQADVELGGTDQKFNLLVGRKLLEMKNMQPQIAMILPILRGTDGVDKMSKSLDNYIGISENPDSMYGKTMSIPDNLISEYFYLVLDKDEEEAKEIDRMINSQKVNPMKLKMELARGIVELFHSREDAQRAEENFVKVFSKRELPEDAEELDATSFAIDGKVEIVKFLISNGIVSSNSEVKRLVQQGAIKVNQQKVANFKELVKINNGDILRIGKKKFFKIVIK